MIQPTDRGSQYTSSTYRDLLTAHHVRQSIGKPSTCWDNAAAESFFATLKSELLHRAVWPTPQHARTAIFHYVEGFYNWLRRHSTLHYQSPDAYEADYLAATLAALPNRLSKRVKTTFAAPP